MLVLILFSFLAGIATVLSPCVIPVLPALLSASGGKGHLRPIGTVIGLVISFVFFTLALTAIVKATGISPNVLRYLAVALIAFFGLSMLFPKIGDWFAKSTSGFAEAGQKVQEKSKLAGSGFWGGFVLGIALGLIWTPCAGPILAAITTLVATSSVTFETFLLVFAYSLGAAIPMFLIIYGGQKAISSSRFLSKHSEGIRQTFGVLMILAAALIAFHFDVAFQQYAVKYIPMINVEDQPVVRKALTHLQGKKTSAFGQAVEKSTKKTGNLPVIAKAPDFAGISAWIHSPPLTIENLKGKVVLVDFWTYSCINCIRTFPYLKDWYAKYKDKGFVIVGVHTPEFAFEKDKDNVADATKRFGILYPVALDNDYGTWQAYDNAYWPAHYLIDQDGYVREVHFGEGNYVETENSIRDLLGMAPIQGKESIPPSHRPITPETYLGSARGHSYSSGMVLGPDQIVLKGPWKKEPEKIVSEGDDSYLDLNFLAPRVYLVLGGSSEKPIKVMLDGKPLPKKFYTKDMDSQGQIFVKEPRKYDVIDLKMEYGRHTVSLQIPKGIEAYAFTFGDEP